MINTLNKDLNSPCLRTCELFICEMKEENVQGGDWKTENPLIIFSNKIRNKFNLI